MTRDVLVGTLPDLVVTVDTPRHPGAASPTQKSPLPVAMTLTAAALSLGIFGILRRRSERTAIRMISCLFILLIVTAGIPSFVPAVTATDTTSLYLIPVTVKNIGGSDATTFTVTIYLDGEKIATKSYDDGLAAGKEIGSDISVYTTPGTHTIRVIVDEDAKIKDGNRDNNVAESGYAFP